LEHLAASTGTAQGLGGRAPGGTCKTKTFSGESVERSRSLDPRHLVLGVRSGGVDLPQNGDSQHGAEVNLLLMGWGVSSRNRSKERRNHLSDGQSDKGRHLWLRDPNPKSITRLKIDSSLVRTRGKAGKKKDIVLCARSVSAIVNVLAKLFYRGGVTTILVENQSGAFKSVDEATLCTYCL